MKYNLTLSALLYALCSLSACAQLQASSTSMEYELPDGRKLSYTSNKEQSGIDIRVQEVDPETQLVIKQWSIRVEKAGTPEAAYAALAQQQQSIADLMRAFVPLIEKLASGAPGIRLAEQTTIKRPSIIDHDVAMEARMSPGDGGG